MKSETLVVPLTGSRFSDFVALTKPRLNVLVVLTATVGYYLGARGQIDAPLLLCTVLGTALVAGGAAGLNQVLERDVDGLMERTRTRPLPDGRIQPTEAIAFSGLMSAVGLAVLALGANGLAAAVALATLASYLVVYTPMKRRTPLATILGAIPGALPPVIGWSAARGALSLPGWVLFGIVFFWQVPHFLAIAWMYRDQYRRAGFPMLAVLDPQGGSTARHVVLYGIALLPVSLVPTFVGLAGQVYLTGALVLGLAFLVQGCAFAVRRTDASARRLFFGSIAYLPLLWILMLLDRAAA